MELGNILLESMWMQLSTPAIRFLVDHKICIEKTAFTDWDGVLQRLPKKGLFLPVVVLGKRGILVYWEWLTIYVVLMWIADYAFVLRLNVLIWQNNVVDLFLVVDFRVSYY